MSKRPRIVRRPRASAAPAAPRAPDEIADASSRARFRPMPSNAAAPARETEVTVRVREHAERALQAFNSDTGRRAQATKRLAAQATAGAAATPEHGAQLDLIERALREYKTVAKTLQERERAAATVEMEALQKKARALTDQALVSLQAKRGREAADSDLEDDEEEAPPPRRARA